MTTFFVCLFSKWENVLIQQTWNKQPEFWVFFDTCNELEKGFNYIKQLYSVKKKMKKNATPITHDIGIFKNN